MKKSFPIFDGMNYFTLNRLSLLSHEVPKQCFLTYFKSNLTNFRGKSRCKRENSDFESVFADET